MADRNQPGMGDDGLYRGDDVHAGQQFSAPVPQPAATQAPQPAPALVQPPAYAEVQQTVPAGPASVPTPASSPPTTERNWMGVLGLVLAFLGVVLPALILGLLGISAASQGRATNRTTSIVAAIASLGWPVLLVITIGAVSTAMDDGFSADSRTTSDIYIGECVRQPRGWSDEGGDLPSPYITVVPCDEPHWAQVVSVQYLSGSTYPDDAELWAQADELCFADEVIGRLETWSLNRAYITYVVPTEDGWRQSGDRRVTCMVADISDSDIATSWMTDY